MIHLSNLWLSPLILFFVICGFDHEVADDCGFDEQVLDVYGFDDGILDVLFLVFGSMPIAIPHF